VRRGIVARRRGHALEFEFAGCRRAGVVIDRDLDLSLRHQRKTRQQTNREN
jgi:hypothetical protein